MFKQLYFRIALGSVLALLLLATATAETRIAIVAAERNSNVELATELAYAPLSEANDIQVLERRELQKVLDEQSLTIDGFVEASQAICIGQLLRVDLFAVTSQMRLEDEDLASLLVFDAASGVRLYDASIAGNTLEELAHNIAAGVHIAVDKHQADPSNFRTISVLAVRNADLPRTFDPMVQAAGRMLEKRLVQAPNCAVLERSHLRQTIRENQQVGPAKTSLLTSLSLLNLELSRHEANGLTATVQMGGNNGLSVATLTARSKQGDIADLIEQLAEKILTQIDSKLADKQWDRVTEASRFYSESDLLHQHAEHDRAAASAAAAFALQPEETRYLETLVRRLSEAAIELVDPGQQNRPGPPQTDIELEPLQRSLDFAEQAFALNRVLADRRLAEGESQQLIEHALQSYMSKVVDPEKFHSAAARHSAAGFVRKFRTYELDYIGSRLRDRAMEDAEAFTEYTAWLARPAIKNVFRRYRITDPKGNHAVDDVVRLTEDWAKLAEQWPPSQQEKRMSVSQFLLSEIGSVQRESATNPESYQKLLSLYRKLQEHSEPMLRFYGLNLELILRHYAGHDEPDNIRKKVQQLTREGLSLLPADILSRRHQPLAHAVLRAQRFLPQEERLPLHREFFEELMELGKYSPDVFNEILRNLKVTAACDEQISLFDSVIAKLEAGELSLDEGFRHDEMSRLKQEKSRIEQQGHSFTEPWISVQTLVDVATSAKSSLSGTRHAIIEPVVVKRKVYALRLSFNQEQGWAEFTLQHFGLDKVSAIKLGTFRMDDFPKSQSRRTEPGTLMWAIERSTSSGSTFIRDACVDNETYFAATMGQGILAYPLAGAEPQRIDVSTGLPSNFVHAVVSHGGYLYGWAGEPDEAGYFFRIRFDGSDAQVMASSRRSSNASPLDNTKPMHCDFMTVDEQRDRIVFRLSDDSSHEKLGLWQYAFASKDFKQLWCGLKSHGIGKDVKRVYAPWLMVKDGASLYRFDLATEKATKIYEHETETPWMFRPFAIEGGEIWEGARFQRIDMLTGGETPMPALRKGTFQPGVFAQKVNKHELLLADPAGIWLITLR